MSNYLNNSFVTTTVTDSTGVPVNWKIELVPDYEIIEEIHIVRKVVRSTSGFPYRRCAFEDWDWERHPVALMYCGCPKCSPQC